MTADFANPPIDVGGLPRIEQHQFVPLDRNFLRSKLVGDGIFAVIVIAATAMVTAGLAQTGGPVWLPLTVGGFLLVMVVLAAVLQTIAVNHLGYLVREHDLTFREGVISRVTQTIPYNRVQHVGIDRGPVERMFGLASLRLRSAGGVIGIEGLALDDANRLKELVVARAGTEGAVAERATAEAAPDVGDENRPW